MAVSWLESPQEKIKKRGANAWLECPRLGLRGGPGWEVGVEKAWRLSEEGRKLLENEDFRGAEKKFAEALKFVDNVWLRNNLATAVFLAGDPSRALEILEPVLKSEGDEDSVANPYTYALASMIQSSLGDGVQARQLLSSNLARACCLINP